MAGTTSGDRAGGRRIARMIHAAPVDLPVAVGPRAWLATIAAIAGPFPFLAMRFVDDGAGGGGGGGPLDGGGSVDWTYGSGATEWWDLALPAAGFALLLAAVLFWVARHAGALVVAVALSVVAPVVAFEAYVAADGAGYVTRAEGKSIPAGASKGDVRRRLGPPAGIGVWHQGWKRGECLVYETSGRRDSGRGIYHFCIDDGRVFSRESF